jgi:hypothetical protein
MQPKFSLELPNQAEYLISEDEDCSLPQLYRDSQLNQNIGIFEALLENHPPRAIDAMIR